MLRIRRTTVYRTFLKLVWIKNLRNYPGRRGPRSRSRSDSNRVCARTFFAKGGVTFENVVFAYVDEQTIFRWDEIRGMIDRGQHGPHSFPLSSKANNYES